MDQLTGMTGGQPVAAATILGLEAVEHSFITADAVHILLAEPRRAVCCGAEHTWFINRDGRTRCIDCDHAYVAGHPSDSLRAGESQLPQADGLPRTFSVNGLPRTSSVKGHP